MDRPDDTEHGVYVLFSRELAEKMLGKWSPPVRITLIHDGDHWTCVAESHDCKAVDAQ